MNRSLGATPIAALALVAMLFAACGDDDAAPSPDAPIEDGSDDGAEPDEASDSDEPVDDTEPADAPADAPDGGSYAIVTIDGRTYEFDLTLGVAPQCQVFAGETIFGNGDEVDESGTRIGFEFPTEGSERATDAEPYIEIDDLETGERWAAGNDDGRTFEPGTSQIDEVTIDGRTAKGTATFIDTALDDRVPTPGTFEVACD